MYLFIDKYLPEEIYLLSVLWRTCGSAAGSGLSPSPGGPVTTSCVPWAAGSQQPGQPAPSPAARWAHARATEEG